MMERKTEENKPVHTGSVQVQARFLNNNKNVLNNSKRFFIIIEFFLRKKQDFLFRVKTNYG